jgi:hypothetical protein
MWEKKKKSCAGSENPLPTINEGKGATLVLGTVTSSIEASRKIRSMRIRRVAHHLGCVSFFLFGPSSS